MKMMRPMPDRNIKTRKMIARGDKVARFFLRFYAYKMRIISNGIVLGKETLPAHLLGRL